MKRISRPCYDKPHRCPGWAGGGMKFARRDRCPGGSVRTLTQDQVYPNNVPEERRGGYPGEHPWRFGHCAQCNTVTWPYITRLLDPGYWRDGLRRNPRRIVNWIGWELMSVPLHHEDSRWQHSWRWHVYQAGARLANW